MKQTFEGLVSESVYSGTMQTISESLKSGENEIKAFTKGVYYAEMRTNISRKKLEKALGVTLTDFYKAETNPFEQVIGFVNIKWYKKYWWLTRSFLERNNKKILVVSSVILGLLIITNPSRTLFISFEKSQIHYSESLCGRKYNFFVCSIYQAGSNKYLGIAGNFFTLNNMQKKQEEDESKLSDTAKSFVDSAVKKDTIWKAPFTDKQVINH